MKNPLPERPDLGQLKKQAKDLLRDIRDRRPEALARVTDDLEPSAIKLQDAQRILSREYGFASWPKLRLHVVSRTEEAAENALVEAALNGENDAVQSLLKERPDLGRRSLSTAAVLGDLRGVSAGLDRDPEAVTRKGGVREWSPLLYLCFGRCGAGDGERAAVAEKLLAAGADPNAAYTSPLWPDSPFPALYGATGVNCFPELARRLLLAGADPNDSESRYHAAELYHLECLEVLKEFGADFSGRDRVWKKTPLYFLLSGFNLTPSIRAGIRWLLAHGSDPNVPSEVDTRNETPLHVAVRTHDDPSLVRLLLDHGADPANRRRDGRTPYALAVRNGLVELADLLLEHGAPDEVSTLDRFLGACMRGDRGGAQAELAKNPALPSMLEPEDRELVHQAARENRVDAITLMGDLGLDLAVQDELDGATPLHWACMLGSAEAAAVLIENGAPLDMSDNRYGAPPIGWVAYGSQHYKKEGSGHHACARALLSAGAKVPPNTRASDEVMAVIEDHLKAAETKEPEDPARVLLYTNGRSAIEVLSAANIPGEKVEWLDVLHEGPVPPTVTREELYRIRARHFASLGWVSLEGALEGFEKRDRPLSRAAEYNRLELWFEHDLFDQLQLIQILDRLAELPAWKGRVFLYQFDTFLGGLKKDEIQSRRPSPIAITEAHLEIAQQAWSAFRSGSPAELMTLVESDTTALPFLGPALLRLCEEFPAAANGLGRTEHELLSAVAGGTESPGDLFRHCQSREGAAFLGDSSFHVLIKRLATGTNPLLGTRSGQSFRTRAEAESADAFGEQRLQITDTGRRVLNGGSDWLALLPAPYWIGGFQISGPGSPRWDENKAVLSGS